jgi:hypothetical protein
VDPADYSIRAPNNGGECQLPAYETERPTRDKRAEKEQSEMEGKEGRLLRLREENKRALRPQGPRYDTEHETGQPCEQFEAPYVTEKPRCQPTDSARVSCNVAGHIATENP